MDSLFPCLVRFPRGTRGPRAIGDAAASKVLGAGATPRSPMQPHPPPPKSSELPKRLLCCWCTAPLISSQSPLFWGDWVNKPLLLPVSDDRSSAMRVRDLIDLCPVCPNSAGAAQPPTPDSRATPPTFCLFSCFLMPLLIVFVTGAEQCKSPS